MTETSERYVVTGWRWDDRSYAESLSDPFTEYYRALAWAHHRRREGEYVTIQRSDGTVVWENGLKAPNLQPVRRAW